MPARGGRTPPRLLLPRCQTAASEPAAAGVQTGTGPPRRLTLPGEETARRLHSTVDPKRTWGGEKKSVFALQDLGVRVPVFIPPEQL